VLNVDTVNNALVLGNDGTTSAFTVRGGAANGTDIQGSSITFDASNGTGSAGSGDLIFRTAGSGASGSVTQDAVSAAHNGSGVTSISWSHTVGSSSNRLLIVSVTANSAGASTVTYGGVNLTKLGSVSGTSVYSEIWYLKNPTSGTATIAVNFSSSNTAVAGSISYSNVNQTTTFGTPATATGNSIIATNSVSGTNANQSIFDSLSFRALAGTWIPYGTQLWYDASNNGGATSKNTANNGATVVTWYNDTSAEGWADIAVAINPISTGSSGDTLTDRLHVAANGNIGIGTSSPSDTLSVATGNIYLGNGAGSKINMTGSPTGPTTYNFYGSSTETILNAPAGGDIALKVANNLAVFMDSSGRLGLNGNATPGATLDLSSTGTIQGGGLSSDCSATNSKLLWSSSTKQFSCGTDSGTVNVRKAANQGVTNSTTVVSDNSLTFAINANDTYTFRMYIIANFTTGTDFKFQIAAPSGATCSVSDLHGSSSGQNVVSDVINAGCGTTTAYTSSFTGDHYVEIYGTVVNSTTAGSVTLKWAQNTSSGNTTTVKAGSDLMAFKAVGVDLAETYYTSDKTMAPADVVSIDSSLTAGVKKSAVPYDSAALGIISTQPGQVLSDGTMTSDIPVPLALTGRVPIKVSTINGTIQPGDYLTTSEKPGVAMRATHAGQMIAKAMTSYSSSDPNEVGTVIAFVNLTWADPVRDSLPAIQMQGSNSTVDIIEGQQGLQTQIDNLASQFSGLRSQTPYLTQPNIFIGTSTTQMAIQDTVGSMLFVADTKNMVVSVANLSVAGSVTFGGHIVTGGDTPTATSSADAVTCLLQGNDTNGTLTINMGSSGMTPGAMCAITFAKPFDVAPHAVFSPANEEGTLLRAYVTSTKTTLTFYAGEAPQLLHTYIFNYWTVQ
jgi:hypothetical protein